MNTGILEAPVQPYVIKSGHHHKDEALEILMFSDYSYLVYMKKKMDQALVKGSQPNFFHMHLEWLLRQGENRIVQEMCLGCHMRPVTRFSVLGNEYDGYSISTLYTCCDEESCKERIISMATGKIPIFFPVKFSSMLYFRHKHDQLQIASLLKGIFNLPQRINREIAFQFFSK